MSYTSSVSLEKPPRLFHFSLGKTIPAFAGLAIFSAFAFALRAIVSKASSVGLPLAPLLMLQSALCLPILLAMAKSQKVALLPERASFGLYVPRVFWGGVTTLLLFYCLQQLPASLATALGYTAPLFTALLAPWLLRERTTRTIALVTAVGFAGVGLNAVPYLHSVAPVFVGIGLLSGLSNALMQIAIRRLAASGEPGVRGVFWMHATTAMVALVFCVLQRNWEITLAEVVCCAAIAGLSCLAQVTNAAAYKRGSALPVNALSFMTLPLTVVLAAVLLHEHVSLTMLLGMGITLPASFSLVWLEQKRLKAAHVHEGPVTVAELSEEHAQVQNALLIDVGPLVYTEVTDEELAEESLARCLLVRYAADH